MLCYNECKRVNYSIAFVIMNGKEFFYVSPDWKNTFLFYKIYHTSSVRRIPWTAAVLFCVNFDKMNGYEFEEYAAGYLKRNGYSKVTVTKASRDFGVDLIAKNTGLPMQSSANYIRERWVTVPYRKLLPVNPITIAMKQWSLPTAFSIPVPLPLPEPMMSFSSTAPS